MDGITKFGTVCFFHIYLEMMTEHEDKQWPCLKALAELDMWFFLLAPLKFFQRTMTSPKKKNPIRSLHFLRPQRQIERDCSDDATGSEMQLQATGENVCTLEVLKTQPSIWVCCGQQAFSQNAAFVQILCNKSYRSMQFLQRIVPAGNVCLQRDSHNLRLPPRISSMF